MSNLQVIEPLNDQEKAAWVGYGQKGRELKASLSNKELELQGILLNAPETITGIEAALADYRKKHTLLVEQRKAFTSVLDKFIKGLMVYEKNADPKENVLYKSLEKKLLEKKIEAEKEVEKARKLELEKQRFLAHFKSEYARMQADYVNDCRKLLDDFYKEALTEGQMPDLKELSTSINAKVVKPRANVFGRELLDDKTAKELFDTIDKPIFEFDNQEIVDKFSTFQIDVQRKEEAIKEAEQKLAKQQEEEKQRAESAKLLGSVLAQALVPEIKVEGKALKKSYDIESPQNIGEASAIIGTFFSNIGTMSEHLRIKDWDNLTVKQMREAIAKYTTTTGDLLPNLPYKETVK